MTKRNILFAAVCLSLSTLVFFASCNDDDNASGNFDRASLLENYADHLIIPAYHQLLDDVTALQNKVVALSENPSLENLEGTQAAWQSAYVSWQFASAFNFGPAGEAGIKKSLGEEIALFPVNTTQIESVISSGTYDLTDFHRDARGFLTAEYLLFDLEDDQQSIVDSFEDSKRRKFLTDLVENIRSRVETVSSSWDGDYRATFAASTGTAVGSSVSLLYNSFLRSYEEMKNFKVALPLGLMVGQTKNEPAKVDAYYSGKSVLTLETQYQALESIWYGRSREGGDGIGFKEYLDAVSGGPALVSATESQLTAIRNAFEAVDETSRMSEQIKAGNEALVTLNTELQKNVRYFKGDMSSLLGLAITFSSNDGD